MKKSFKTMFEVLLNAFLATISSVIIYAAISGLILLNDIGKYGPKKASIKVLGIDIIYAIPNRPECHNEKMTAKLVEVKAPNFMFGEHTDYYLKFEGVGSVKIRADRNVVEYSEDKIYEIRICDGEISQIFEPER